MKKKDRKKDRQRLTETDRDSKKARERASYIHLLYSELYSAPLLLIDPKAN